VPGGRGPTLEEQKSCSQIGEASIYLGDAENRSNCPPEKTMSTHSVSLDHVAIRTYLRIDAAPNDDAFKVTIDVPELELLVEAIERDVGDAIHAAADQCAERLRDQGYSVSAADVLGSLETLEHAGESAPPN
jgi:hypothetical protein